MFPLIRYLLLTYMGSVLLAPTAPATAAPGLLPRSEIMAIATADVPSSATATVQAVSAATSATLPAALPAVKAGPPLKIVVRRLALVEEPTASPAPAASMTLAAFLRGRLGSRYHARGEWAGHLDAYRPRVTRWRVWEPLGRVNYITIHHAEGIPEEHPAAMIRNIYRGHTNAGGRLNAPDVGYHFFIDRDGGVWEGRDARKLGTHVGSTPDGLNNAGNLGVCGLGSFIDESPRARCRARRSSCATSSPNTTAAR
ncbi:MAG: peptidoglycan recognition family protein [Candidatus Sumerlaeia bacterium]